MKLASIPPPPLGDEVMRGHVGPHVVLSWPRPSCKTTETNLQELLWTLRLHFIDRGEVPGYEMLAMPVGAVRIISERWQRTYGALMQ